MAANACPYWSRWSTENTAVVVGTVTMTGSFVTSLVLAEYAPPIVEGDWIRVQKFAVGAIDDSAGPGVEQENHVVCTSWRSLRANDHVRPPPRIDDGALSGALPADRRRVLDTNSRSVLEEHSAVGQHSRDTTTAGGRKAGG